MSDGVMIRDYQHNSKKDGILQKQKNRTSNGYL